MPKEKVYQVNRSDLLAAFKKWTADWQKTDPTYEVEPGYDEHCADCMVEYLDMIESSRKGKQDE